MNEINIRLATHQDLPAINDIYNHYVIFSTCTYQWKTETMEERAAWFANHGAAYPVTVAELGGEVVGWGSLSPFHPRAAYRFTVGNSLYVRHDRQRRGVGRTILTDLVARARALGRHSIIGLIDTEQAGSIALHTALGFQEVGRLKEVGWKFERWLGVVYVQLQL